MIAFRNVTLVKRQLNSSVMRWLSQEVAVCVIGVGQRVSLKVALESLCFHSKSDCTGSRQLVV